MDDDLDAELLSEATDIEIELTSLSTISKSSSSASSEVTASLLDGDDGDDDYYDDDDALEARKPSTTPKHLRAWLGQRNGEFEVTSEMLVWLVAVVVYLTLASWIGYRYGWPLLGGLCALVVLVVPLKWLFLFYLADFERDASLFMVVRLVALGFVVSIPVTLSIDLGFLLLLRPMLARHGLEALCYVLMFGTYPMIEIPCCFVAMYALRHSRHMVNIYSGFVYGLSFGVGFGAFTATFHIVSDYVRYFATYTNSLPYFLWVVKHLYSLNFLMACSVWIGLGVAKRRFAPPIHSASRIDDNNAIGANSIRWRQKASWLRTLVPPFMLRQAFLFMVSTLPNVIRVHAHMHDELTFASNASLALWLYVCEDLVGLVFFVCAFIFLLHRKSTHAMVLQRHVPDPVLYYNDSDELEPHHFSSSTDEDDIPILRQ